MTTIPFPDVRARRTPLPSRLGDRQEPCAVLNVAHMQDRNLRAVTEIVEATMRNLLLSLPHEQAEEQLQNAVDLGFARAMRQGCGNE